MIINHNMNAMNAHRQMMGNISDAGKSMEKLSSGLRINRAGDDAAGLAISEKMRGQIRGLDQATRNSQDGISLIQTAEGALNETHSILQRMRELSVQASNDTNNTSDRGQIQKEMDQLTSEVNRIGNTTEFNTMKLLNGDRVGGVSAKASIAVGGALGVTATNGGLSLANGVTISSAATDIDWTTTYSASTNAITISKNANGDLRVQITGVNTTGVSASISADDTIAASSVVGDTITYNNHGVSFSIKKTDLALASTGAKLDIALKTASNGNVNETGTYATNNDFSTNSAQATISSGITINASTIDPRVKGIKLTSTDIGTAGGTLKIEFFADTAGTTVLDTDILSSGTNITAGVTYNNHGISFTVKGTSAGTGFITNVLDTGARDDHSLAFQVGANQNQSMSLGIGDMRAAALGITTTTTGTAGFAATKTVTDGTNNTAKEYSLDVTTVQGATNAITIVQNAIDKVSDERSKLGSVQNRLEHTINNLGTSSENLQAAESRIRDVDMANEMMSYSKKNILSQASQAMLAQAKSQPEQVLQLLR